MHVPWWGLPAAVAARTLSSLGRSLCWDGVRHLWLHGGRCPWQLNCRAHVLVSGEVGQACGCSCRSGGGWALSPCACNSGWWREVMSVGSSPAVLGEQWFPPVGRSLGQGRLPWGVSDAEARWCGLRGLSWPLTALLPCGFVRLEGGLLDARERTCFCSVPAVLSKWDLFGGCFL